MHSFLRRHNVDRYRRIMAGEGTESVRPVPNSVVREWERELAVLDADAHGVARGIRLSTVRKPGELLRGFEAMTNPAILVHPGPGLRLVDVNEAYAGAAMIDRRRSPGQRLFSLFPDNPEDPAADGVSRLYASLRTVAMTRRARVKPLQRYDVRDADGRFVERWWRSLHTPIFAERDGRLLYLLVEVEDVTSEVLGVSAA